MKNDIFTFNIDNTRPRAKEKESGFGWKQQTTGQAQNSAKLIFGSKNIIVAELRASWPGR
jgi:hypothetical protein